MIGVLTDRARAFGVIFWNAGMIPGKRNRNHSFIHTVGFSSLSEGRTLT